MPYDDVIVLRAGNLGGALLANKENGRFVVTVDENATEEEVQDTIKWARETLENDALLTPEETWRTIFEILGPELFAEVAEAALGRRITS